MFTKGETSHFIEYLKQDHIFESDTTITFQGG